MAFDRIEQLKQQYTDKYVVVDATRPELARFRDVVGRVRTVNMSGRALVEFLDYHVNIGWYDIDPDFLKVVAKPEPKAKEPPAKKPPAKKRAGEATSGEPASAGGGKKLSPLEMARAQGAAQKAAGGKPSTADILAAARGGKPATPPAVRPAKAQSASADAAAAPAAQSKPAQADRSKMSVANMLAAARAGGAAKPQAEAAPNGEHPEEESAAEQPTVAPASSKSTAKLDKSSMTVDEIIAWCREHDAK